MVYLCERSAHHGLSFTMWFRNQNCRHCEKIRIFNASGWPGHLCTRTWFLECWDKPLPLICHCPRNLCVCTHHSSRPLHSFHCCLLLPQPSLSPSSPLHAQPSPSGSLRPRTPDHLLEPLGILKKRAPPRPRHSCQPGILPCGQSRLRLLSHHEVVTRLPAYPQ